nr:ABC transporter permease [Bacteroidota bacterium]
MIRNILTVVIRNLRKSGIIGLINIFGLSIGIACAIIVFLYVRFETGYDKHFNDFERIYRIRAVIHSAEMDYERIMGSTMIPQTLRSDYPQVEYAIRLRRNSNTPIKYGDQKINLEYSFRAEPDFFQIFNVEFIAGSGNLSLSRPNTAAITEKLAKKLFGDLDPIGKIVTNDSSNYQVTAVISDWPANTHFSPQVIFSWEPGRTDWFENEWGGVSTCYIKLKENVDARKFDEEIRNIEEKYSPDQTSDEKVNRTVLHFLQPLTDIHLRSNYIGEFQTPGSLMNLRILVAIGILVLLIACVNYMNLVTAKFMTRAREIGIRKTVGATRQNLIFQFLLESFLFVFIAHIIAMFIIEFSLPELNTMLNLNLSVNYQDSLLVPAIVLLILVTTLVSGSYPAFFLSSYKAISVLKGKVTSGRSSWATRKILVIFQFTISIMLIIGVITTYYQVNFMKNYPLGFDKEQKLVLRFPRNKVQPNAYKSIKTQFLQNPIVKNCCFTSSIPGEWNYGWRTYLPGEEYIRTFLVNYYQVDEDFAPVFGLEMVAGEDLFDDNMNDSTMKLIINEEAVKTIGWASPEDAIGKNIWSRSRVIVGVFKDFHFEGLQTKIEPMGIFRMDEDYKLLIIDLDTRNVGAALEGIEKIYSGIMPEYPFDYFFMDDNFNKQYRTEEMLGKFITILAFLGIVIACLGLLGLASFMTQQRTKETGIRKVNGATETDIIKLFSGAFIKWILIANLIAWPVSFIILNNWLQNFAYRVGLQWWIFALAGAVSVVLTLSTVTYQAMRAARANPVDAIKYE